MSRLDTSINCEMDTKIEIKEEDPFLDDIGLENDGAFFSKDVTVKTNNDDLLLNHNCDVTIKTEIKSEIPSQDIYPQKGSQCFTEPLVKNVKSETVICRNKCEIKTKTEIGPKKEREFLQEDPAMKVKEYNNDNEIDNKIEIKEEPWWLEQKTSSLCDDIKDRDFTPVKLSRLYSEAVSGDSCGTSDASRRNISFSYGKDYPEDESNVTKVPLLGRHVHSEQSDNVSDVDGTYNRGLLLHKGKMLQHCNICGKRFTHFSDLKLHTSVHEGKKLHKCKICEKKFTKLSNLKTHTLIHEGKRPHKCDICGKSFTQLAHLKKHNLIHEANKTYRCEICDKDFSNLSYLRLHYLMHEGKKTPKCEICEKTFTRLSSLKLHNLIHQVKKPQKCKIPDSSFTQLSNRDLSHEQREILKGLTGEKIAAKKQGKVAHLQIFKLSIDGKTAEGTPENMAVGAVLPGTKFESSAISSKFKDLEKQDQLKQQGSSITGYRAEDKREWMEVETTQDNTSEIGERREESS